MGNISIKAHAKINLSLSITGRREDGYHLMDSLVVFADIADQISIEKDHEDSLTITGSQADGLNTTDLSQNILITALDAYRTALNWDENFALTLEKNIPVAAGIGGGSSDAAAILTALNRLHPSPCSDDKLAEIGLQIGADLPVCLKQYQSSQWRMRGIGEDLTPMSFHDVTAAGLILVNPMVGVSTKDVFGRLDYAALSPSNDMNEGANLMAWLERGNDLAAPAMAIEDKIKQQLDGLSTLKDRDGYLHHGMSGSGATCFALFENAHQAILAHDHIKQQMAWSWAGKVR